MPSQHTRELPKEIATVEGIVVPLDLPEFALVGQEWHGNGSLIVTVIAKRIHLCALTVKVAATKFMIVAHASNVIWVCEDMR